MGSFVFNEQSDFDLIVYGFLCVFMWATAGEAAHVLYLVHVIFTACDKALSCLYAHIFAWFIVQKTPENSRHVKQEPILVLLMIKTSLLN